MTIVSAPTPMLAGPPGQSAYALAVVLGFTGTEQEWIASLQGQNGVGLQGDAGADGADGAVSVPKGFTATGNIPPGTTYAGVTGLPIGGLTLTLYTLQAAGPGAFILIADETGNASTTSPIIVQVPSGLSDNIAGKASMQIIRPFGSMLLFSGENGTVWTLAGGTTAYAHFLINLPTSEPSASGQLWNNGGVISVS